MDSKFVGRRGAALVLLSARLGRRWSRAKATAVLRCSEAGLVLIASDRLTQPALDYLHDLWRHGRQELRHGSVRAERGLHACLHVVVPCVASDMIMGLLYLETPSNRLPPISVLHALGSIVAVAMRTGGRPQPLVDSPPGSEPRAPVPAAQGTNLQALLERHEWNVARVARLLGVTRMTVYNRMRRLGVRRCKIRKSAARAAALPSGRTTDTVEVAHV